MYILVLSFCYIYFNFDTPTQDVMKMQFKTICQPTL